MLKRKTVICSGVSSAPDNIRLKDYDIVLQHQQQNDLEGVCVCGGGGGGCYLRFTDCIVVFNRVNNLLKSFKYF